MLGTDCHLLVWVSLIVLILALVISLFFNVSHWLDSRRREKVIDGYVDEDEDEDVDDYVPREEESYTEDPPIYGNLTQVSAEPVTESCYEQMRARPPRSGNQEQEPPVKAQTDIQMCYASLDHSFKGKPRKPRKPRKPKVQAADLDEDEQLSPNGPKTPLTAYHQNESFQAGIAEESIHDDPIRLFGLIHAERELVNGQDGNPSR